MVVKASHYYKNVPHQTINTQDQSRNTEAMHPHHPVSPSPMDHKVSNYLRKSLPSRIVTTHRPNHDLPHILSNKKQGLFDPSMVKDPPLSTK